MTKPTKPNILVLWGDDIGWWNISYNSRGQMGYRTPNIDRVANEGVAFTDYYAQQSCTAGRSAFISGSVPVRNGMTKVGLPGAKEGWKAVDCTMATVLKAQGYATGHFGKWHGEGDEIVVIMLLLAFHLMGRKAVAHVVLSRCADAEEGFGIHAALACGDKAGAGADEGCQFRRDAGEGGGVHQIGLVQQNEVGAVELVVE